MTERLGSFPSNPEGWENQVRKARESQLAGARSDLAQSREVQYNALFEIKKAATLEEKKAWGKIYKDGILGVLHASIIIGDQKVRDRQTLTSVEQELIAVPKSIKLALDIQLGKSVDEGEIKNIVEGLGLQVDRNFLIDRIKDILRVDSEEIDRKLIEEAVRVTDKSVSFTKRIQRRVGVKEDIREYEQ